MAHCGMSLQPLKELGLSRFSDLVFHKLKKTVTTILIDMVNDEREGQLIDRALIKEVVDIYVEIAHGNYGLYQLDFEQAFLKGTTDYYSKKAQTWILEDSCPDYMLKVDECLQKEKERVAHYLRSSTEPKLMKEAILELLGRRAEQILNKENSGCRVLLRDGKTGDLSRMFSLFSRMETGLLQLSKVFKEHVSEEGLSLWKQANDAARSRKNEKKEVSGSLEQDFVWKVIELHDKYLAYVANCFQNNNIFHKSLKDSFEVICSKAVSGCTSAEMVAAFCDNILRKGGSEKLRDEAVEEILDKVVNIITYISDKDLFVEFHRKKLGKRLLFDKSANDEYERSLLRKLKKQYGGQFTSKMEGMLTDMTGARDHQTKFEEYMGKNPESNPPVDLSVTVLTTGHWPTYKSSNIILPSEMIKCVEVFKDYYHSNQRSRKLTWMYSMGSCNIVGKFDTKPIELIATTYQVSPESFVEEWLAKEALLLEESRLLIISSGLTEIWRMRNSVLFQEEETVPVRAVHQARAAILSWEKVKSNRIKTMDVVENHMNEQGASASLRLGGTQIQVDAAWIGEDTEAAIVVVAVGENGQALAAEVIFGERFSDPEEAETHAAMLEVKLGRTMGWHSLAVFSDCVKLLFPGSGMTLQWASFLPISVSIS